MFLLPFQLWSLISKCHHSSHCVSLEPMLYMEKFIEYRVDYVVVCWQYFGSEGMCCSGEWGRLPFHLFFDDQDFACNPARLRIKIQRQSWKMKMFLFLMLQMRTCRKLFRQQMSKNFTLAIACVYEALLFVKLLLVVWDVWCQWRARQKIAWWLNWTKEIGFLSKSLTWRSVRTFRALNLVKQTKQNKTT